jgi:hypothetical protein
MELAHFRWKQRVNGNEATKTGAGMDNQERQICMRIVAKTESGAVNARERAATAFNQLSEVRAAGNAYSFVIADASVADLSARTRSQAEFIAWLLLERDLYSENCYVSPPKESEDALNQGD